MEQPIWIIFGVIAVVIGLGIIANVIGIHREDNKMEVLKDSMEKMQVQCDFVCGTTKGNLLSIDVKFPAEMYLYTTTDKICATYDNTINCVRCACQLEEFTLNLNTSLAKKINQHSYSCFFERLARTIEINCRG